MRSSIVLTISLLTGSAATLSAQDSTVAPKVRVTSGATITGARIDSIPLDDPTVAFGLFPGVFLREGTTGVRSLFDLSIRGGAPGAAAIYIDGAPMRSRIFGTPIFGLAPGAVQSAELITGVAPTWMADASGGVISYATASGGDHFVAHGRAESDAPFGSGVTVGYNRFEGALGGPLAAVPGLHWQVTGTAQGQLSPYLGSGAQDVPSYVMGGLDTTVLVNTSGGVQSVAIPKYIQYGGSCNASANAGFSCQGLARPMDWSSYIRLHAKLDYAYGNGSTISVTGLANGVQQRFFPGSDLGDPALYRGEHEWSRLGVINWHQALSTFHGGPLALDVNLSLLTDRDMSGPLTPASELATREPSLGIEFGTLYFGSFNGLTLPLSEDVIRDVRTNSGFRVPYFNRTDLNTAQPYRMNPYGVKSGGWVTTGSRSSVFQSTERDLTGRWQLDWHASAVSNVTIGADAESSQLTYYTSNTVSEDGLNAWTARPKRIGLFVNDRLDWGKTVMDLGLRYDHVGSAGVLPLVPGFTFGNLALWDPNAQTSDAAYAAWVALAFRPMQTQSFLLPRVRLGMALSPTSAFRFGFGQHLEPPSYGTIFSNSNSDLSFASANLPFGRDVRWPKVTQFDVGLNQRLGAATALDLALYEHHYAHASGYRIYAFDDPANPGRSLTVNVLSDVGSQDIFGLDFQAEHRMGPALSLGATYSLQIVSNPESSILAYLNANARAISGVTGSVIPSEPIPGVSNPAIQEFSAVASLRVPSGWSNGTLFGDVARDVAAEITFRAINGQAYTPLANLGAGVIAPGGGFGSGPQAGDINSRQLPWTKVVDLRVTKGIHSAGLDWTLFADVRNLANFHNVLALFAETNDVKNPLFQVNVLSPELANNQNDAANNSALRSDGALVLNNCAAWSGDAGPVNCVMLARAEARFGNGDGVYTLAEQTNALNAWYDSMFGSWAFLGPQRTIRMGLELTF